MGFLREHQASAPDPSRTRHVLITLLSHHQTALIQHEVVLFKERPLLYREGLALYPITKHPISSTLAAQYTPTLFRPPLKCSLQQRESLECL